MVAIRSGTLCASVLALTLLGACDSPPPGMQSGPKDSEDCVVLAEGLYEFQDGQFLAVSAESLRITGGTGIERDLQSGFATAGFPWMGLKIRGRVATVTGSAPSPEAKSAGLSHAETTIAANPQAGSGMLVIDGISVEGGERGAGESLAFLSDAGTSLESCQRAFTDTMAGRSIQFESSNARISPVSTRLLDALSGVATLCSGYVIEIGGHTGAPGGDDYNLKLSQDRADAVKAYLAGKGIPEESLLAVGYGETRLLDPATTPEANDRNRRIEFKVIAP